MDEVYRPLSENDDETPPPAVDFKIESYNDFQKALKEHVGASDHDLSSEEVADDITPRRQREEAPSPENASERPLVRMRSTGDGPLMLQEASDDIRFSRARQQGADLAASVYNQDQINEYARVKVEASLDGQPDNPDPPVEVKLHDRFGEEGEELTAHEAAEKLGAWREEQERQRQAELAELVGQPQEQAEAQQAQQPVEQPQSQPQLTPEQAERQQLAQERQQLIALKRIEGIEASWRHNYDQLRQAVANEFPGLSQATAADVEQLRVQDPARFQRLAQYDAALKDRQQKIAALSTQRMQREQQQEQAASAERAAARAAEDAAFERLAAQHIPNWERVSGEVRQQARTTLENAGLSREQIHYLWNGDHSIDAHSSVLQLVLAKAALYDRMQTRAHEIRQAPVPPVMRPGTYRARDDGAQSVRDLQMQLKGAKGRDALRIATEITRARRANGV